MLRRKRRKAQSILEYTLLLGVIIGLIVTVMFKSGGVKDNIEGAYDAASSAIADTTSDLNSGIFQ